VGLGALAAAWIGCGSEDAGRSVDDPTPPEEDGGSTDAEDTAVPVLDIGVSPTPACVGDDPLGGNNAPEAAYAVSGGVFQERGLVICPGISDWFRVEVDTGQRILARMRHVSSNGLLNLYLYPASGPFDRESALASSETDTDEEAFEVTVREAGAYLVEVAGLDERDGGPYDLRLSVSCSSDDACDGETRCSLMQGGCVPVFEKSCGVDRFEQNDRMSDAPEVVLEAGRPVRLDGLRVCEDDEDYFEVVLEEPGTLRATILFDPTADLDLGVFDAQGRRLGLSATRTAPEEVILPWLAAGSYYVGVIDQVAGLGFDVDYVLELSLVAELCGSNRDCAVASGRPLCEEGTCVPFAPEGPVPAGGLCEVSADCESGFGCYQGSPGIDDNFCTTNCERTDQCGFLEGGYCLDLFQQRVCFSPCGTDSDCPTYWACGGAGQCEILTCDLDAECDGDRLCRRTEQQAIGVCTAAEFGTCAEDDRFEPNDTDSEAALLPGESPSARGLTICDDNDDWFRIEVEQNGTTVQVVVDFDTGVDIDVQVYDATGRLVAAATSPDANPEVARARSLAAGSYLIRVNQFPGERDTTTLYNLVTEYTVDPCDAQSCLANGPIRPICEERACRFINGEGTIPPGGLCDANEDCDEGSEFCWVFEGAASGRNVCTRTCITAEDCVGLGEGAQCQRFGRGFSACLPG
jgi:hypothetical protein